MIQLSPIQSTSHPRQGWAEEFEAMAQAGDDVLLDEDLTGASAWDEEEWEW